ncbi:GNAT family N-acetyltransferase [Labedaea rhizosphaerae]|uniref:Acetyltransferase (GNAT) family protein n=1 Tax=Labedaea rhizosphaerae TaxID=598644 RepID=A0A4R6SF31_LABRH|nr:GNAT family N-acetyltransferase [Labedaea rhizosphaerae]TDQ00215.1 acetyltransferase (GNAT) family protein [Labedaea rhizosphaerae]
MESTSALGVRAEEITRVSERHWHALADDRVVGRAEATRRPDGRTFLSIDVWHDVVFDQLARVVLAELPRPLHTIVDEADAGLTAQWRRAGFTVRRREWEYLVPTDPALTGLGASLPEVTILPAGQADEQLLRALDRSIRDEVGTGWPDMPAEVLPRPAGVTVLDPAKYTVAMRSGQYAGLCRLGPVSRQPRIGLLAVRREHQRRGVARALLAHVLDLLHRKGIGAAWADVTESAAAATALFEGIGARRSSSTLELLLDGQVRP